MVLVQLGANVGNDHVQKFIEGYNNFSKIVLVEPVTKCHPTLKENYKDINNVHIESSVIISDPNALPGKIDFYLIDYPEYNFQIDNFEVSSLYEDITRSRGVKWKELGRKLQLDSLNFESLVLKYNLDKVDYLFCDIEGEDEKVLNNLDLSKYDFKIVMWERNDDDSTSLLKQKFFKLDYKIDQMHNNAVAYKEEYENHIQNIRQWL
jgi:FkbM family methyltransferase